MHDVLYSMFVLAMLACLACLIATWRVKRIFRDSARVIALSQWMNVVGVTFVVHLVGLLFFVVYAATMHQTGTALVFLALALSPFAIGLIADDYRKVDRFVIIQLLAYLLDLTVFPILFFFRVLA